jgi:hypothetical protein
VQQCTESKLFEKQHSQYHSDFVEATKLSPIQLIQLSQLFCEGSTCTMAKDGQLFFRDDNHLNINGSRYIAKNIVRALSEKPARQN